jgi:hypothetical protein
LADGDEDAACEAEAAAWDELLATSLRAHSITEYHGSTVPNPYLDHCPKRNHGPDLTGHVVINCEYHFHWAFSNSVRLAVSLIVVLATDALLYASGYPLPW